MTNNILPTVRSFVNRHPGQLVVTTNRFDFRGLSQLAELAQGRPTRVYIGYRKFTNDLPLDIEENGRLSRFLNLATTEVFLLEGLRMKSWLIYDRDRALAGLNGSANLTGAGFNENVEVIAPVQNDQLHLLLTKVREAGDRLINVKNEILGILRGGGDR